MRSLSQDQIIAINNLINETLREGGRVVVVRDQAQQICGPRTYDEKESATGTEAPTMGLPSTDCSENRTRQLLGLPWEVWSRKYRLQLCLRKRETAMALCRVSFGFTELEKRETCAATGRTGDVGRKWMGGFLSVCNCIRMLQWRICKSGGLSLVEEISINLFL